MSRKKQEIQEKKQRSIVDVIKNSVPSNVISIGEYEDMISSSAILKAMQKCDISEDPTDTEKLQEVFNTPELMARAISLIVSR